MRQKRPHHKSRYGCDQCRKRRVKCDEKVPRCSNCIKRDDQCHFSRRLSQQCDLSNDDGSRSESLDPGSMAYVDTLVYSVCSPNIVATYDCPFQEPHAITDVALMHHWCTRTCHSFTPQGAELLREHAGKAALRHEYLMEALLATTLLHMVSEMEDPMAARPLVKAALLHQNRSILGFRSALNHISPSNCDAIFACSVLIMVCAIISPLVPSADNEKAKPIAESILLLADFMGGIASIVQLSRQWIVQGRLSGILSIVEPKPSSMDEWVPAKELRHLMDAAIHSSSHKYITLESAIQGLENVFRRDHCAVLWVVKVDSEFMEELRTSEPFAMMILMHWGVLLHVMDEMWWKQYSGLRLVEELSVVLLGRGQEWDKITRWCRQQVGLD